MKSDALSALREKLLLEGKGYCNVCKRELPIENFTKESKHKIGYSYECRECKNEKRRKYVANNAEFVKTGKRKWKVSLNGRYWRYRDEASRRKLSFDLTIEEFNKITQQPCTYCGKYDVDEFGQKYTGVDRVDSTKGDFLDNVTPCCFNCNKMKSAFAPEDWWNFMRDILEHLDKTGLFVERKSFTEKIPTGRKICEDINKTKTSEKEKD